MSPGTIQDVAVSVALTAGVSLVSNLLAGDKARVSYLLDTVFQHIALLPIGTSIAYSVLPWVLESSQVVG